MAPHTPRKRPVDKTAANTIWLTPEDPELAVVRAYAPIGLDPCTEPCNPTGATRFFSQADNGLAQDWSGHGLVFVNPPYSLTPDAKAEAKAKAMNLEPPIRTWAKKIGDEARKGVEIIALLPCGVRFSTRYWQPNILRCPNLNAVCFRQGRVKFIDGRTGLVGKGNNSDSALYGFNVVADRFLAAFDKLGAVWVVRVPGVG